MKKLKVIILSLVIVVICLITGCASCERGCSDFKSEINNGLNRRVNVYTINGDLIASYEGKIDIETQDSYILFHFLHRSPFYGTVHSGRQAEYLRNGSGLPYRCGNGNDSARP